MPIRINFQAKRVSYSEALGGEIVQVWFEEDEEDDSLEPTYQYLLISTSYEIGSSTADAEWFDGIDYEGGVGVVAYNLSERKAMFRLKNGYIFEIGHKADASVLENIGSYLSRHCTHFEK